MHQHISRRRLLAMAGAASAAVLLPQGVAQATTRHTGLRDLENRYGVRLGVYARNLVTGRTLANRPGELFPILSVFKPLAAAAILRDVDHEGEVLDQLIRYSLADIVVNSPITSQHVDEGMTVRELCDAAIRYSDNTAGNLLLRVIGGPSAITGFARSLDDCVTRLDRWEPDLNESRPLDPRDTTSPLAIAKTYVRLVLGRALAASDRSLLRAWLLANQTSFTRFRAGLPEGWTLADKTGAGGYGSLNDVGIAWKPDRTPVVIAALSVQPDEKATANNQLMADVAALVTRAL